MGHASSFLNSFRDNTNCKQEKSEPLSLRTKVRIFDLVEKPRQNPNSAPTRSRQVRLSASHVDSCRSRPVYHRTHTRRLQMYQSGVSENHGLLDRHDGTAQTMPSSVRGSAFASLILRNSSGNFATAAFGFGSVTGLSSRILALPSDASLIRSTEISK